MKKKSFGSNGRSAFRNWYSVTDRGDDVGEAMAALGFVRKAAST
jgi:hypothetical protein